MTLKDVAAACGVSIATVSAVVNGAAWVSATTRARVQATVDALGYHPNQFARALRRRGRAGGDAAYPTAPAVSRGPDVAPACGVSTTTVSAVVRGLDGTTPATRIRVQAAVAAMGYRPDCVARALGLWYAARSTASEVGSRAAERRGGSGRP